MSIPPSLPSTIFSPAFGGASIKYKLRAQAVRAGFGFHQNLQAARLVPILRSLPSEAMEYQQTLEIENSWPGKLMYSVILPHKAWAVGDKITAILKCAPLAKGVAVIAVESCIEAHTTLAARPGSSLETTKDVAYAKYDIVNGRAIESSEYFDIPSPHSSTSPPTPSSPAPAYLHPLQHRQHTAPASTSIPTLSGAVEGPSTSTSDWTQPEDPESSDLVLKIALPVRSTVTPSHDAEPITVAHRIRWYITISNPDGHISELRCSLPIRLLDHHLLAESRKHSCPTRRLILGGGDCPAEREEEAFLPSYSAHIRDRVANMYFPDSAAMRINNPWVFNGDSPTFELGQLPSSSRTSGDVTPLEQRGRFSGSLPDGPHLPGTLPPQPGAGTPRSLDWVDTELLLSLSGGQPLRARPDFEVETRPHLSRAPSGGENSPPADRGHPSSSTMDHETSSRTMHNLFHNSIKPFTSSAFHPTSWLPRSQSAHSHYANNHHSTYRGEPEHVRELQRRDTDGPVPEMAASVNANAPTTSAVLLHRAFTETPDYAVAARGFLGGVPPLTSMEGLPSYEETQRVTSESAL